MTGPSCHNLVRIGTNRVHDLTQPNGGTTVPGGLVGAGTPPGSERAATEAK